jgi:hypothetical protein
VVLDLVEDFGAAMDGGYITVSMTAASAVATSASWTTADVGKAILVEGAGAAGVDLQSTVVSVVAGVSATLNDAASTSVTNASATYGTDDAQAWQDAFDYLDTPQARGGKLIVRPNGTNRTFSILGSEIIMDGLQGVTIEGQSEGGNAFPILAVIHGTGAGLRLRSNLHTKVYGLTFQLQRQYGSTDANFSMLKTDSAGTDNMNVVIERCSFQPGQFVDLPDLNGGAWLNLNVAIFCHIVECSFQENFSGAGIELGTSYVNVCSLRRNVYNGPRWHILLSSGDIEALTIDGETFEPNYVGQSDAIVGIPTTLVYGMEVRGCWLGDIGLGGGSFISNVNCRMGEVHGNTIHGVGVPQGAVITTTQAGSGAQNEKQLVVIVGSTGTFTLTWSGQTTGAIAVDADAATVQAALEALSNIDPGDVVVTDDPANSHDWGHRIYTVEFTGALALADQPAITADTTSLGGDGAYFTSLDGNWDVHSNHISGSGTYLLDFTDDTPELFDFHDNYVGIGAGGGGLYKNGTLPIAGSPTSPGWRAWNNLRVGGTADILETGDWTEYQEVMGNPYTLDILDAGKMLKSVGNPSPLTVTVPASADVPFHIGTRIRLMQQGSGQVTVAPDGGVTIRSADGSLSLRQQYSVATLVKLAADEWALFGDLQPSKAVSNVASAANITIPAGAPELVNITGTADISSITAGFAGQRVTLKFAGTAATTGLIDGSNLNLSGDLGYTPDDTITLVSDATDWYEVGRSVN